MSLLEMSFAGGVLILAVTVLRALALNRLPKGTFLALWAVAALRLLVPFSIPSPASVYNLVQEAQTSAPSAPVLSPTPAASSIPSPPAVPAPPAAPASPVEGGFALVWVSEGDLPWLWLVGMAVCGTYFLIAWLRCRRKFRAALPVENAKLHAWLEDRRLRRTVSLRQSDRIDAPLTYGLLRPVVLLPKNWEREPQLDYVLAHELAHVRHLDALWKPVLALTACVHWFNPLVWCMLVLANRDMELRCDEAVVRQMGLERRAGYARALISLEEQKSGLGPFASAFNQSAIEERIRAIMNIKKRSLAAVLAAAALVCFVGVGFATSSADNNGEANQEETKLTPYPEAEDGTFTKAELDRLASLWFEGYEDMTVAEYQQKMWTEFDTPEDIALIDRYGQNSVISGFFDGPEAAAEANAFYDYFHSVYEPLTAERWQERTFSSAAGVQTENGGSRFLEYACTVRVLDRDMLTVGEYRQTLEAAASGVKSLLEDDPVAADFAALSREVSTDTMTVAIEAGLPVRSYGPAMDEDAELHAQSSRESAAEWDRQLSPYAPFGLTWTFDDPDLDGNGLTMWFEGKEVRSITDTQEGVWITEHTGDSYPDGAVDLYAVYTGGVLSGLRFATAEEQEVFDKLREGNGFYAESFGKPETEETREFPRATLEDYDSLLALRTVEYADLPPYASSPYPDARDLSLADFNQRLLDWANEHPDAWDRINCDVLWNDFDRELTTDAKTFASVTCYLSGIENGQTVRALYTGEPEEDPHLSASLSEWYKEENGIVTAWCDLYYDISYHVADKSAVTARERDACVSGMRGAISTFWRSTDCNVLLQMTEDDVVAQFNAWAAENSTEGVKINPVTANDIHFEPYDERGID